MPVEQAKPVPLWMQLRLDYGLSSPEDALLQDSLDALRSPAEREDAYGCIPECRQGQCTSSCTSACTQDCTSSCEHPCTSGCTSACTSTCEAGSKDPPPPPPKPVPVPKPTPTPVPWPEED